MDPKIIEQLKRLMKEGIGDAAEEKSHEPIATIKEAKRLDTGGIEVTITLLKDCFNNEHGFRAALQNAMTETIQHIASIILNERRAEIEDACNFGELRDVLAAELARQFMASRLTGAPTPFDKAQAIGQAAQAAQVRHFSPSVYTAGTKTP